MIVEVIIKDINSFFVLLYIEDLLNWKIEDFFDWVFDFSVRLEMEMFDNGFDFCRYCVLYINFKLMEVSEIVFYFEGGLFVVGYCIDIVKVVWWVFSVWDLGLVDDVGKFEDRKKKRGELWCMDIRGWWVGEGLRVIRLFRLCREE